MRDYRKFCRPKTAKSPKTGDVVVKLNCGEEVTVSEKDYNSIKKFFKVKSLVGSSSSSNLSGLIKATSKETGLEATFSPEVYNTVKDNFEISEVIGAKNISEAVTGDIICHNSILNTDAIFSYTDWLTLDDDWSATGILGITTIEEENTVGGEYVIMANGTTFIINMVDYSKVKNQWERIEILSSTHDYVEIGGIKWATMNLGAFSISDPGLYFAWGETIGYSADRVGIDKGFTTSDYKFIIDENGSFSPPNLSKYNNTDNKLVLESEDDAVSVNWGGNWRMPTQTEYATLVSATTQEYIADYNNSGVSGVLFTDKEDSSKTLFFPKVQRATVYDNSSLNSPATSYLSNTAFNSGMHVYILFFTILNDSIAYIDGQYNNTSMAVRFFGNPVRGVLDE